MERALVARVNTLLASQGLTATTVGDYPRTELTIHGVEQRVSYPLNEIWTESDPWDYRLEQEAQSFAQFYATEAEEH